MGSNSNDCDITRSVMATLWNDWLITRSVMVT